MDARVQPTFTRPLEIERRSFEIIRTELCGMGEVPERTGIEEQVLVRTIHATADFEFARTLTCTEGACEIGVEALRQGCAVCCDTTMVAAGINKRALSRLNSSVYVFVADEDVAEEAARRSVTRSVVAMERTLALAGPKIVVVGNAPTALLRLTEHVRTGAAPPALVVGVPVGFVNVVEAKEELLALDVPSIVARGRKGGSTVAVAIMNALIYAATGGVRSRETPKDQTT